MPALLPRRRIEGHEVVVRRQEIDPVAVHADAAVADVDAAARLPEVVPDFAPGPRVDGPDVIGRRKVQRAVDHQRRRFDGRWTEAVGGGRRNVGAFPADVRERLRRVQPVHPGELEIPDVVAVDLRQRAVAPARIVAVIGRPRIRRHFQDRIRIERALLGHQRDGSGDDEGKDGFSHFTLARYAVMLCMSASVHFVHMSMCACIGSTTSIFGVSPLRGHERICFVSGS